jgi:hypothetical protein
MVDVACRSRWARAARGVVALMIEGGICSGSLLNTLPPSATSPAAAHSSASPPALLLTAYHCVRPLLERWEAEAREAREAREAAGEGAGEASGEAAGEAAGDGGPLCSDLGALQLAGMHSTGCMPMPSACPVHAHGMPKV